MKKKNEENLPEQGCGIKMPAENEATNEVVKNETVNEETAEEDQEEEDSPGQDGEMEFHASKKDFLVFMHKLLRLMKDVVFLNHSLHEFEEDPIFDLLLDLSKVHLKDMNRSSREKESSDEENDKCDEEDSSDDEDTITEAFISLKVKKLKD
ncbi:MAG: hypothetical protein J6T87_09885 [Bacteroidales bacterium]|nr:hypothetical protein [Bacteroidales bacterium]